MDEETTVEGSVRLGGGKGYDVSVSVVGMCHIRVDRDSVYRDPKNFPIMLYLTPKGAAELGVKLIQAACRCLP